MYLTKKILKVEQTELVRLLKVKKKGKYDFIINLQGDIPFLTIITY